MLMHMHRELVAGATCAYSEFSQSKHLGSHTLDLKTFDLIPDEQVDDFADAQRTPLPDYVAGFEGDEV